MIDRIIRMSGGVRPVLWGLLTGCTGLVVLAGLLIAQTALSYDGDCGGLMPFMGETGECTLLEYLRIWLPFSFEVVVYSYWPFLVLILLLPPALLWSYHRYLARRAAKKGGK